jgi:hypothetical protein
VCERRHPGLTEHVVDVTAAEDQIVAGVSCHQIVATEAIHDVVARSAEHLVAAFTPCVPAGRAVGAIS